ncbi:transposable element Tcb1 transposase [Trichonephila clavipes]|nr:transposable element Tcb1 transposase [Trichonephila clavipes]
MDNNARPHRANIVDEFLQSEDITRMDWPAYSPDLNPIEHVWDMLGRRIVARQPRPTCLPELRSALLDEWCNISQDQIDNLILSMPRRWSTTSPVNPRVVAQRLSCEENREMFQVPGKSSLYRKIRNIEARYIESLSQQCLQGYDIFPWPVMSPDLSPIQPFTGAWKPTATVLEYSRSNFPTANIYSMIFRRRLLVEMVI